MENEYHPADDLRCGGGKLGVAGTWSTRPNGICRGYQKILNFSKKTLDKLSRHVINSRRFKERQATKSQAGMRGCLGAWPNKEY